MKLIFTHTKLSILTTQ